MAISSRENQLLTVLIGLIFMLTINCKQSIKATVTIHHTDDQVFIEHKNEGVAAFSFGTLKTYEDRYVSLFTFYCYPH